MKPLHDRYKASHRIPKGKIPSVFNTPELREEYKAMYQKATKNAPGSSTVPPPTDAEIAAVVVAYWSKV